MKRTAIRELTFKLLYSIEIQQEESEEQIELYIKNNDITDEESIKYLVSTINGISSYNKDILNLISSNLKQEWKVDRISKVDLAILKLAIFEIKYTDVPYKVAINEAVEIAKKYGEDASPNFINGILANIVKIGE